MHNAFTALQVLEAQLLAPDTVIEQDSEVSRDPLHPSPRPGRGLKQPPRLRVAEGESAAFVAHLHIPVGAINTLWKVHRLILLLTFD